MRGGHDVYLGSGDLEKVVDRMDAVVILPDDAAPEEEEVITLRHGKLPILFVHDPRVYSWAHEHPILSSRNQMSRPLRLPHRYDILDSSGMAVGMHVIKRTKDHGEKKLLLCLDSELGAVTGLATKVYRRDTDTSCCERVTQYACVHCHSTLFETPYTPLVNTPLVRSSSSFVFPRGDYDSSQEE